MRFFQKMGNMIGRLIDDASERALAPDKPVCRLCGIAHSLPYKPGGERE